MIYKKHCEKKWIDCIVSGKKTVEGRLQKGDWLEMKNHDVLILFDQDQEICCEIVEKTIFKTFEDAFDVYGTDLLPDCNDASVYQTFYSADEVLKYGVVLLHLKLLQNK